MTLTRGTVPIESYEDSVTVAIEHCLPYTYKETILRNADRRTCLPILLPTFAIV